MFYRERKEMITFILFAILAFEAIVIWCLVIKMREVQKEQSALCDALKKNTTVLDRMRRMCQDIMENIK